VAPLVRIALAAAGGAIALAAAAYVAAPGLPVAAVSPDPAPVRGAAQPRFALELDLVGVIEAGGASTAIIAEPNTGQRAFHVGEAVRPGLVLEKIARDGVVLAAGEARYRLLLKRTVASAAPSDSRAAEPKPDNGLASWQQRNSNPEMPQQGLLTPQPGGGMRLEGVKPGSPYAKMGFQAGDVLLSVNRAPLESPEQLMRLFRSQRSGPQQVEVLREGRFETLRFGPG
jgi:type II secretory pathway component PulC